MGFPGRLNVDKYKQNLLQALNLGTSLVALLLVPPVLGFLLGNYLCTHHDWGEIWKLIFILIGLVIGFYNMISYLLKISKEQ
jgi:F0F1-type ATP synthase assembly protein I